MAFLLSDIVSDSSNVLQPRQIALIVDLTSLHLPITPFLESHQEVGRMAQGDLILKTKVRKKE